MDLFIGIAFIVAGIFVLYKGWKKDETLEEDDEVGDIGAPEIKRNIEEI